MKDKIQNKGLLLTILLVLFFSMSAVSAHQPRLETGTNVSMTNPIVVQNPEVSQAFYSTLQGSPDYYKISSDVPFKLYLNLLVPASPGVQGDFVSAQVLDANGNVLLTLNGTNSTWKPYFEEFGGDNYLKGPEVTEQLPAGSYFIKVFNAENQGKYTIAIGDIESFPIDESLKALVTIPLLKEQFFGKPLTTLFFEFLGLVLALGSIMVLYVMLIKSRKSEELTALTIKVSGVLKPVTWIGILITAVVWLYVMYKDPLNIVGIVNSILLVVLVVLSWYTGSKISKSEFGKIPLKSMTLAVVLWWLFVYLAIALI
jgi:hypothetical protein